MAEFLQWRQTWALCRKNWLIMSRHWIINFLRCVIIPIAYAAFLSKAMEFFAPQSILGRGSPIALQNVDPSLLGLSLIWAPPPSALGNPNIDAYVENFMSSVWDTLELNEAGRSRIKRIDNATDMLTECPQNFNLQSDCFAGIILNAVDPVNDVLSYTLRTDGGLIHVDVENHASDAEKRALPLQWAIDSTFIAAKTGVTVPRPSEWPYTRQSNEEQAEETRINFVNSVYDLIVLAFFVAFLGAPYQLAGAIATERTALLTSHLEAMGCLKSARAISWHLSVSLVYLPAWIISAVLWQREIFTQTSLGFFIFAIIFSATALTSFSMLVAAPFASRAPTLAAITAVLLAFILAVVALVTEGVVIEIVLGLLFPPTLFTYIIKAICSFESEDLVPSLTSQSPRGGAPLIALFIIAIIDTLLFPILALWVESRLYDARPADARWWQLTKRSHRHDVSNDLPAGVAIQIDHLRKEYPGRRVKFRKVPVVAVDDLTLTIPANRIFCLLGRNGSGKSTTLGILSRLQSPTMGTIRYNAQHRLGIGPQKNVLFDELTCRQHLKLWKAIKTRAGDPEDEEIESLLVRCDLANKIDQVASSLSGGQKRKLQLAIALVGGSNLLFLDEISSGLDSLARRAIWRVILSYRKEKTIVMTTHFLDESDFLADEVGIIKAPGMLVAQDTPQDLKANFSDQDYGIRLSFVEVADPALEAKNLETELQAVVHHAKLVSSAFNDYQVANLANLEEIMAVAKYLEAQSRDDIDFEVSSPTLEDVFLKSVADQNDPTLLQPIPFDVSRALPGTKSPAVPVAEKVAPVGSESSLSGGKDVDEKDVEIISIEKASPPDLHSSKPTRAFQQSWTILRKRAIVFKRAWALPLLGILVAILPSVVTMTFLSDRDETCAFVYEIATVDPMTYPFSPSNNYKRVLEAPPDALSNLTSVYPIDMAIPLENEQVFIATLDDLYRNLSYGGVSVASDGSSSLFAYEASASGNTGSSVMNLLSNVYYDRYAALTGYNIIASFSFFPGPDFSSTGKGLKWLAFFGLALGLWPAFFLIYPCGERASRVQTNQYSNGMRPAGLWLGHLLWELPSILIVATILTALFASSIGENQFHYLGLLWLCLVLYGIAACLFSFVFTLFISSQLAAFALYAAYNIIIFLLYLCAYLLTLTYDRSTQAAAHITLEHFTISLLSPVCSIIRAGLVSINMFSLLCDGLGGYTTASAGSMTLFGGPIVYLLAWSFICFGILVYVDSGAPRPQIPWFGKSKSKDVETIESGSGSESESVEMVAKEKQRVLKSDDPLRILNLRKQFGSFVAIDDITFGVKRGDTFALLGPNGAGKTTTLSCIRGDLRPDKGDVILQGRSIIRNRNRARATIGMCPQSNPIDATLTTRQHLMVYGRLKGLNKRDLEEDVAVLLSATGLDIYADRAAKDLSGGNQRKLCLAIALIGGPSILLVDEYSSGVDPTSRRDNWGVLKRMTKDKAVVFTTHSMEEVQALASRAAIIARQMLAVGSLITLKKLYGSIYELHLTADQVAGAVDILRRQGYNASISEDTVSRIEVSLEGRSFSDLFVAVEEVKKELGLKGIAVSPLSVESVFMKIVRQHNIEEEGHAAAAKKRSWYKRLFRKRN